VSRWCDAESGRTRSGMKALVPDGDNQISVPDGEGAREMHGIGAAEGVMAGQLACLPLYGRGFARSARPPGAYQRRRRSHCAS